MRPGGRGGHLLVAVVALAAAVLTCLVLAPRPLVSGALGVGAIVLLARASLAPATVEALPHRDPMEAVFDELDRSRRYDRRCTLARVAGGADHASGLVRRTDDAWVEGHDLMVLMPETDRHGARLAVTRLVGEPAEEVAVIATFPDDALTARALLAAVRSPVVAEAPREETTNRGAEQVQEATG